MKKVFILLLGLFFCGQGHSQVYTYKVVGKKNGADGDLNDEDFATIRDSLEKRVKDIWNLVIGSQVQLNKNLMIRAEYGFLGSRTQFLNSVQYRFGL